jgi:hypothetical protein
LIKNREKSKKCLDAFHVGSTDLSLLKEEVAVDLHRKRKKVKNLIVFLTKKTHKNSSKLIKTHKRK